MFNVVIPAVCDLIFWIIVIFIFICWCVIHEMAWLKDLDNPSRDFQTTFEMQQITHVIVTNSKFPLHYYFLQVSPQPFSHYYYNVKCVFNVAWRDNLTSINQST